MTPFATHPVQLACILLLGAAVYTDFSHRIIPNPLIAAGVIGGLFYQLLMATSTSHGLLYALSGMLTGGLLLIGPYRLSWTGAGDVKLLGALGAWVGSKAIIQVFVCTTLVGGLMSAALIVRNRNVRCRTSPAGRLAGVSQVDGHPSRDLPYALAMGGGYALYLLGAAYL